MVRGGVNSRIAVIIGALAFLAGCNLPNKAPENVAADNLTNVSMDNVTDTNTSMTAPAPLGISWRDDYSGSIVIVQNVGQQRLTLQKIVVNGQEGDRDCDIKVFKPIEPGATLEVPAPRCGAVTAVRAITDNGETSASWSEFLQSVRLSANNLEGYRSVTVRNVGTRQWTVNKIVLNDQQNDPDCDVKVFRPVPPQGSIDVTTNDCGQINTVKLITSAGESTFTIRDQYDSSTNTTGGM